MYYDDSGSGALAALLLILIPVFLLVGVIFYVVGSYFLMRIFESAGVQGKWRAWVPVYNILIFAKLGDVSPWIMLAGVLASSLLSQVPVLGWLLSLAYLALLVMAGWRVGLKLNKDWPYLLLWLLVGVGNLIWFGILAFTKDRWNPALPPAPWSNTFLGDKTVWDGIPVQPGAAVGYQPPPAPPAPPQNPEAPQL